MSQDLSAADDGADGGPSGPAFQPSLTQAEVDAIVGYADAAGPDAGPGTWRAMAGAEPVGTALPLLDAVLDRFVRRAGPALSARLGGQADLARLSARTLRFSDYLDLLALPADAFAFEARGWGGSGAFLVGPGFAPLVLDALLGGGAGRTRRPALRPATAIETGILSRLVGLLLDEAGAAFSDVAPVALVLGGAIDRWDDSGIARPADEVLVLAFEIAHEGVYATFDLVLPAPLLQAVKPLLAGRFTGEKLGRDELWASHLATEVWSASLEVEAVLDETTVPIGRLLDLAIGETLMFNVKPTDLVELRSGSLVLTRGRMGRVDGRIALQVVEPLRPAGLQRRTASIGRSP